ncbi:DMT family transporter [Sulfitobacter sp. HNIBRBA2951]|uniref:DMT family transporter n=1 Tax=Sulfitobacter aquimarinus TaxID=3158557 RepID=UPI0032E0329D
MTADKPALGILLMLGFCIIAPLADALAKLLGASIPLGQLVLVRFAVQAALLLPVVIALRMPWRLSAELWRLVVLRTVLHIAGIALMFSALKYLPLADAVAIAFVMPFIMLLLGRFVLGEEVGPHRLAACSVGFIGTLLVIQPNFRDVGWVALLPLGVAVVFALFMLTTRQIAKHVDAVTLQAVSGTIATVMLLPVIALGITAGFAPLTLVWPDAFDQSMLLAIGVLGTGAHLLMTWSLRFAPGATVAPMQYLEIPFATLIGFWVFNELPDRLAAYGIALTIAAGLYIIIREQANARRLARNAPPAG